MKSPMREVFADQLANPLSPKTSRVKAVARAVKRAAQNVRSDEDRVLESLAQIGSASGVSAFEYPCLVGTFHKTGTFLMIKILTDLAQHANLNVWNIGRSPDASQPWDIGFDWWSDFHKYGIEPDQHRTAVILRDPRDVIVSSMKFHLLGKEPWLLVPQEELGGKSYQKTLMELTSDEERFHFELKHQAGATIEDMLSVKRHPAHRSSLFLHLESLMEDRTLTQFRRFFNHLGLADAFLPLALAIAFKHSVFNPRFKKTSHVTSGHSGVWRTVLPTSVLEELNRLYPDAVSELGTPLSHENPH